MKRMKNNLRVYIWVGILFVAAAGRGCALPVDGFLLQVEESGKSKKWKDKFISLQDLKAMEQTSQKVRIKKEKSEHVWSGVAFIHLLELNSIPVDRIKRVFISAYDGYMAVLSSSNLQGLDRAILAVGIRGERRFPDKFGYMRIIFPDLMAMYWVNSPSRIKIILKEEITDSNSCDIYFSISSRIGKLLTDKNKFKIGDLLKSVDRPGHRFHVLAQDSLFREYAVNRIIRNMVFQKEDEGTFKIGGVNVPTGLKTRRIFFLQTGDKSIFLKLLSQKEKELWEEKVWLEHIAGECPPEGGRLFLFFNDGSESETDVRFDSGVSLYNICKRKFARNPHLDFIRLKW